MPASSLTLHVLKPFNSRHPSSSSGVRGIEKDPNVIVVIRRRFLLAEWGPTEAKLQLVCNLAAKLRSPCMCLACLALSLSVCSEHFSGLVGGLGFGDSDASLSTSRGPACTTNFSHGPFWRHKIGPRNVDKNRTSEFSQKSERSINIG